MKWFWTVILFGAVFHAHSATLHYAAGVDQASVSNAVVAASNGDVILIPAGSATWTNTLITTKRVMFIGANSSTLTNETRITVDTASTPIGFQGVSTADTNIFGASYFFLDMNNETSPLFGINVGSSTQTTNKNFRLHHLHIDEIRTRGINTLGVCEGLVDQNWLNQPFNFAAQALTFQGWTRSSASITTARKTPIAFGTSTNYVYVERNLVSSAFANDSSCELYRDAQVCVRSNYFGTTAGVHDHTGNRSAPTFEWYGNYFGTVSGVPFSGVRWLVIRTGIGPIYGNTVEAPSLPGPDITVQYYRAHGTNTFQFWYAYSHVATAPSPASSGTSLTVTSGQAARFLDSGFPYGVVIWPAGAQMSAGNYEVATATGYNDTTGIFTLTRGAPARTILVGDQIAAQLIVDVTGTNTWDHNAFNDTTIGYPALDQYGWSDPVTWTSTNSTMTFYGGWSWNNTVNGDTNVVLNPLNEGNNAGILAYDGVRTVPQTTDLIVEGRDIFSNTVMTNYTALGRHPYAYDVTLDPASTNIITGTTVNFTANDSLGQSWFLLWVNNSGATINESTGEYTAGDIPGVVDVVRVVDQIGGSFYANVSVEAGPPPGDVSPGFSRGFNRKKI